MRTAMIEDTFCSSNISQNNSVDVSERVVRNIMETMADLGWLEKQNPNRDQWQQGPLMTSNNTEVVLKREKEDPQPVDQITQVSELNEGEVYIGVVDKASSNALIWLDEAKDSHINLGPIDESVVDEEVRFRYIQGVWGKCLDEEYTYQGYDPQSDGSSSSRESLLDSPSHRASKTTSHSSSDGTITENNPDNKNELLKGKL